MQLNIKITKFDNEAMAEDPEHAVAEILRGLSDRLDTGRPIHDFDGVKLMDLNGNPVGVIEVIEE